MADITTTLILKGKVGYEEEITAAQAAQIIAFLNAGPSAELGQDLGGAGGFEPGRRGLQTNQAENARDAILRSGATTNAEKIVALAAYVLQDGGETVKADAIKSQFQRARESPPAKFTRDLGTAISAGWMSEGEGGELFLTTKVDGIFDEGFVFPKPTSISRSRSSKKAQTNGGKPESLAGIEEFVPTMSGYPSYSLMKTGKDRLLWVVTYMREAHDRRTVTNKEISWITDHIGVGIPNKQVAAAFNSAKTAGYATRSTTDNSIKVTDNGTAYLKGLVAGADD